jgi:hypothetical protein
MQTEFTDEERETWRNIWNELYDRYYEAYFEELRGERLISIWKPLDVGCRVLLATTAAGSAVSGWALWQMEGFKTLWTIIAGFVAFVAIAYSVVGVSERYREVSVQHAEFRNLRIRLEDLRTKMTILQYDSFSIYKHEFSKLLEAYSEATSRAKPSTLGDAAENAIQAKLNKKLGQ